MENPPFAKCIFPVDEWVFVSIAKLVCSCCIYVSDIFFFRSPVTSKWSDLLWWCFFLNQPSKGSYGATPPISHNNNLQIPPGKSAIVSPVDKGLRLLGGLFQLGVLVHNLRNVDDMNKIPPNFCPYGGFLKWWYPQIIHFNRFFHYKPSILGYPYFWKHPYVCIYVYYTHR